VIWLKPVTAIEGQGDLKIQIKGNYFMKYSSVRFNGIGIPTTFINQSELEAILSANLLKRPGTFKITVMNPTPAGGQSVPVAFMVTFS
jgi:hypothetical protein